MTEHEPKPVSEKMGFISLCAVCYEKVRKIDGKWEHFGEEVEYEAYII